MLPLKTGNLYSLPLHSWFRFLAFSGQQIRTSPGGEVKARSRKKASHHLVKEKKATHHLVKESLPGDGRRPPVGSPWTRPPPLVALHPPQLPVNLSFWIKMCLKSDLSPLCCSACQAPPALSSASPAPPVERGRQPSPLDPPCIGCCSGSTSEHPRLPGI